MSGPMRVAIGEFSHESNSFCAHETEIEQLMETIKKAQEREFKERKSFESYLGSLDIE